MLTKRSPGRTAVLLIGVLALSLLSCGREITAPASSPVNLFRRLATFAFDAQYETAIKGPELRAALSQVAFERVRVTLRREDGSIALDTVVDFPAGAESLTVALSVPLAASAPASGVPLNLNLGYVNAAGDTVFKGGPIPMTVVPATRNGAPPPPVQVPVQYTGTGANATRVAITPKTVNGVGGQSTTFTAQALGATGAPIAGTPIVFTSTNPAVIRFADPGSGVASFVGRGTARVIAQLLTGPADTATVAVTLPAARIELAAGGGQEAAAGTTLPAAVRARVVASDGVGVGGISVAFAVSDGGTVTPATAVSSADGSVSATWTLGLPSGAQKMTITSTGLANSPLTVPANALIIPATQLAVTGMPSAGVAGAPLGAMTVAALDANGNVVPTFNGDVRVAIGTNPGNATITGNVTAEAVRGVATFTGLSVNRPGAGYTFTFSSGSLREATSGGVSIAAGPAATLVMDALPATVTAGNSLPTTQVRALDALGNVATGFTGAVTVTLAGGSSGAAMSGTATQNATAGVASFTGLTITKAGSGYTLGVSAGALPAITSSSFAVVPGAPKTLEVVSGADQSAVVGTRLGAITVRLLDAWGNAIQGKSVALAVTRGGGSLAASSVTTDASGIAGITWTLGGPAGAQSMTATVSGVPTLTINATGLTGPAVRLAADSGAAQSAPVGSQFAQDLVVLVTDSYGNPVKDKAVTWRIAVGSGTLGATSGVTDSDGRARTSFTLPTTPGLSIVQATVTGLVAANFTATAETGPLATFTVRSGAGQSASAGAVLSTAVSVQLADQYGNPIATSGVRVDFDASHGGSATPAQCTTDGLGRCSTSWRLGATAGGQTLTASSPGLTPVSVGATAVALGGSGNGGDLIVLDDVNWGDNGYGFGGSYPGNRKFVDNLVGFTPSGTRAAANKILQYDETNSSYSFNGNWSSMRTYLQGKGYVVTVTSLRSSLTAIANDVKVLFLQTPYTSFTTTEINALKTFAAQGGRIVFIGENPAYYSQQSLENAFLSAMGSSMTVTGSCSAPGEIVTAVAHALTSGVSLSGSGGFYMNCASHHTGHGAGDVALFRDGTGKVVGSVLAIDYTLIIPRLMAPIRAMRVAEPDAAPAGPTTRSSDGTAAGPPPPRP
jgi:hypothetical protein